MYLVFFPKDISIIEIIEKFSTITIALFTLVFSWYIFEHQSKKDKNDLKLDWFKLIIIETKFESFFDFFKKLSKTLDELKLDNLTLEKRSEINTKILDELSDLQLDFVSLLLSVDKLLYECVKTQFDDLVDGLTLKLSNDDLSLNENETFKKEISTHVADYKTQILKMFVDFKGNSDTHQSMLKSFKEKYF